MEIVGDEELFVQCVFRVTLPKILIQAVRQRWCPAKLLGGPFA